MVWNNENLAAWEHPGYVDPQHDQDMGALADTNAAREADQLRAQAAFRTLHVHFVAEKRMQPLEDNEVYLEKWYDLCTNLCKSMSWNPQDLPAAADDTFIDLWRRAEIVLNEDKYNFSTHTIFE